MKKLLREPILHFLLIGMVLFFLIHGLRGTETPEDLKIQITADQVTGIAAQFEKTWMRPPTENELSALVDRHIRNEVAFREAMKLGLDQNDTVINQRLRMKLELMLDNMTSLAVPSDPVLTAFLQENPDRFAVEPRLTFQQIYLNPDKHAALGEAATAVLTRLKQGVPPEEVGDPTMIGYRFDQFSQSKIERKFGEAFAKQLIDLEPGDWTGPIFSGLGGHLVKITQREEGRLPELSEVRAAVEREWMSIRQTELKDAAYASLMEQYEITVVRPGETE